MELYRKKKIIRKSHDSFEETEDVLAVEKRLTVSLNGEDLISLYCSPSMIPELLTGFFFTQGLLPEKLSERDMEVTCGDDLKVDIVKAVAMPERSVLVRHLGGTGIGRKGEFRKVTYDFSVPAGVFEIIFSEFQKKSELFRLTGCFHSAAVSDGKNILAFAEDIGRHNALDKVVGFCLLNKIPFTGKLLLVSCRVSSEIMSKCLSCGIPVIASVAAPTGLAVEMAEEYGITLVGFARRDRLNIYTNPQRVIR